MAADLVGREVELSVLREEAEQVAAGRLRCVLLTGDPGVGKSSLAECLTDRVGGFDVLTARAHPLGSATSFGLWAEALDGRLRGVDGGTVRELSGGFVDDLGAVLRSVAAARGGPPDTQPARHHLVEALAVLLSNLAAAQPLLVVLDDLHWADTSSLDALDYIARNLAETPLLLLLLARRAELAQHEAAMQTVLSIEQQDVLRRLTLGPLDTAGVTELARARLDGADPPIPLVRWLAERSEGNPLFANGLLQALLEEGAELTAPSLQRLPEALKDRVAVRLAGWDEPAVSTLETLAIVGRRVDIQDLEEHTARPLERLAPILDQLTRAGLVVVREGRVYEIAHPLIGDAIYEQMGSARRHAQHRLAARTLSGAGRLGEAATHYARSARPGEAEAVAALVAALAQTEELGAYQEGFAVLGALLDVLPSGDERWKQVLHAFDPFPWWIPDHRTDAEVITGLRAVKEIEAAVENAALLALAVLQLRKGVFLAAAGECAAGKAACERAAELYREAGEPRWARIAMVEVGWAKAYWLGEEFARIPLAEAVVAEADREGDPIAAMYALRSAGYGYLWSGQLSSAIDAFERTIRIGEQEGRTDLAAGIHVILAVCHLFTVDAARARATLTQARRGNREIIAAAAETQHVVEVVAGDYRAAAAVVEDVLRRGQMSLRRASMLMLGIPAYLELDLTHRARSLLDGAQAVAGNSRGGWGLISWADGLVAWREGHLDEAFATLRDIHELWLSEGLRFYVTLLHPFLAEVAIEGGRADEGAELVEEATRTIAGSEIPPFSPWLARARLRLALGDPDAAAADAQQAVEGFARLGHRGWEAQALTVLGEALTRSDRSGGIRVLQQAAGLHDSCGAVWRRERVLRRLTQLGHRGRRAAGAVTGPESLTEREQEVAGLAASGLTAKEIAGRLFLGDRTVETHLSNAYAKLGVANKRELVQRRADLGLDVTPG